MFALLLINLSCKRSNALTDANKIENRNISDNYSFNPETTQIKGAILLESEVLEVDSMGVKVLVKQVLGATDGTAGLSPKKDSVIYLVKSKKTDMKEGGTYKMLVRMDPEDSNRGAIMKVEK